MMDALGWPYYCEINVFSECIEDTMQQLNKSNIGIILHNLYNTAPFNEYSMFSPQPRSLKLAR